MRVFVLCTGRSGSVSFVKSCQYINNFTSDHESLSSELGEKRFDYPDNHIEGDNRLSWLLGQLDERFGDEAFYVHLTRDRDKVAKSFTRRFFVPRSIIDAYSEGIKMTPPQVLSPNQRTEICYDYVDTVESNIRLFLKDKSNWMKISIEDILDDLPGFWDRIGAEGSLEDAMNVFKTKHNQSSKRPLKLLYRWKLLFQKEWKHLLMNRFSK